MSEPALNLYVVELDDEARPRRHPDLPNLYVGQTLSTPEERVQLILNCSTKKLKFGMPVVRGRLDLLASDAVETEAQLRDRLSAAGYTVNTDTKTWRTYVIELDDQHAPAKKRKQLADGYRGWVYVGETSLTAQERWERHKTGKRRGSVRLFNPKAHEFGLGLHPTLMSLTEIAFSEGGSKKAEKKLGAKLEEMGYIVEGGR